MDIVRKVNMSKVKKLISIQLILFLLIGVIFQTALCVRAETSDTAFQIKIVHTNDIHARVEENSDNKVIGIAKLKTIADTYTAGADMDLVVDSGDLFHGQPIATLSDGEAVARLVKECGYDAMTPGNHDWSYGKDQLKTLGAEANLNILAGNVEKSDGTPFFDKEYYTEEVKKDGKTLKVGIFGMIDPKIYSSTAPANVEGLIFTDLVEYANKAAAELKSLGCDIVIALSHIYEPAAVASEVNNVDIWLCGHEHLAFDETVTTPNGDAAYLFEDGYYLNSVGLIEVTCTMDEKSNISDLKCEKSSVDFEESSSYQNNEEILDLLTKIQSEQDEVLAQTVGTSPYDLDGEWDHLRIGETNLGKAIASAYILETGADVAFENAGGIRSSVTKGKITYGDVIGVSPYGNYIVTKQITGAQLIEIMETSLDIQRKCIAASDSGDNDAWPKDSGSYLQFAGMTVTYNPTLEKGNRIISIQVGKEKLDKNKLYTVAANNYAATSSDYPALANAAESGEFAACDTALIRYFGQDEQIIEKDTSSIGLISSTKSHKADYIIPVICVVSCFIITAVVLFFLRFRKKQAEK